MQFNIIKSAIGISLLFLSLNLSAQTLVGVWEGIEIEVIGGPNPGVTEASNPRILIYTDAYFSWVFDQASEPRQLLSNPPADSPDALIGRAARPMNVAAGTYQKIWNTIVYNRLVSLLPNAQAPEAQPLIREIRTLTHNLLETQLTNEEGVTTVLRYKRLE